ncbi:TPA: YjeJ family protein, partial [Klebsiella quasipneumoniae subsp. similipneumoniae]
QQYPQEEWKLNLFSHYLGVLYCCETDEGKKIVSGAVVKTSAPHLSELENNVVMQLIEKSPKLKAMHAALAPCQIFSTIIPSQPGRMLSLEECLRPLHAFYLEKKAELNA